MTDLKGAPTDDPHRHQVGVGDSTSRGGGGRAAGPALRLLRPLEDAAFRRLAAGRLLSALGDWLTLAALVGWMYHRTGTGAAAAVLLVRMAPPVLGGALAAWLVDRLPRGRLLVWVELGRGSATAVALAALLLGGGPLIFVAYAASTAFAVVSSAAARSVVPGVVCEERLPAANALLGISQEVAMAAGTLAAGIALAFASAAGALAIDVGTFALAALLYAGVRGDAAPPPQERQRAGRGLRPLLASRILLGAALAFATAALGTGLTNATLPRLLEHDLGLGTGGYGFGLSALAIGLALGAVLAGLVRTEAAGLRPMAAALAGMGAALAALGLAHSAALALGLLVVVGFFDGTTEVFFDTIVQREADPSAYGRVFGAASTMMNGTMIGAIALAPVLNTMASPRVVLLCAAAPLGLAGLVAAAGSREPAAPALLASR